MNPLMPAVNPLSDIQLAQLAAKALNKPILYLSGLFNTEADKYEGDYVDPLGRLLASPFISIRLHPQAWLDGSCFIIL